MRGKPSAHYNGYAYRMVRENKVGVMTWVCLRQKSEKCKGRLKSKNGRVIRVSDHGCEVDEANLVVKKTVCRAKVRAREENTPISKLYSEVTEEICQLHNRGYDCINKMPGQSTLKRYLYKQRSRAQKELRNIQDGIEEIQEISDGSGFLLTDDGAEDLAEEKRKVEKSNNYFFG